MTDLERARAPSDKAFAFARAHRKECVLGRCYSAGHGFCLCKDDALMLDAFAAAARQEGAEEMRERAAHAAERIYGRGYLADAIRAIPLTPEEPT